MRYLITCCKVKNDPSKDDKAKSSGLQSLSFKNLEPFRAQLIKALRITLNWNYTLPAYRVYGGRLYSQIDYVKWAKPTTDILILSALFGWIRHTDCIPYYDLSMNDTVTVGNQAMSIKKFWNNSRSLDAIVQPQDINLLSGVYRKAIDTAALSIALQPNFKFTDSYGVSKGRWLNLQL